MKKSLLLVLIPAIVAVAIVRCGGGGGAAKNATAAKTEFTSPTGTVTNDNATAVVNDVLSTTGGTNVLQGLLNSARLTTSAVRVMRRTLPFMATTPDPTAITNCVEGSSDMKQASINLKCVSDAGFLTSSGCTASGTITWTVNGDNTETNITFGDVAATCTGSEVDFSSASCNGTMSITGAVTAVFAGSDAATALNSAVICADLTCTVDSETDSFNGCEYAGKFLVDGEGGSVVCSSLTPSSDCSTLDAGFDTAAGAKTVSCTVNTPHTGCPPSLGGVTVTGCTVQ